MRIQKRWKRFIGILIALPLVLLGGALLYIQGNQAEIIQAEVAKLNETYQGRIAVGNSDLSLFGNFPDLSIKIYDVQVFETKARDAAILMDVKDIYVGFNLWDVLGGTMDIRSLLVEDGVLNIVIHENNTTNIQNALSSGASTDSSTTNIHLKKIVLRNLDIHTLDEASGTDVEKFIYAAKGGFRQTDSIISGHIDTELELNVIKAGDTTFFRKKHFEIHTDLVFNEASGVLSIEPSGIVLENGDFELEGFLDTQRDMYLDLAIKGTKPNFDMLVAFAPADVIPFLEKYRNAGEIYFNAQIVGSSNKGNSPAINAEFGASEAFLENTARAKRIDEMGFKGHFSNGENRDMSTMEFSLTDMTASLENGEFTGSLFVKNFESPEVDMKVNANFNLDFIAEFFEVEQVEDVTGQITLKMNFHDIVDIDHPEKALQQLNQAYFAELKVEELSLKSDRLPAPLDKLNINLVMDGKEASLEQFNMIMGESDVNISGYLSDLPAIVHHTDIPVVAHLDIASKSLDIAQLTGFKSQDAAQSAQDSTRSGIDEQIENLSLGLSFNASARDITESEYLPQGHFYIDSLFAELQHYPHTLHDFHADVLIDSTDLVLVDFRGFIDDSDITLDAVIHDYAFWFQPELEGDVKLDIGLTSERLRLEDVFSYKGENYVPEEYRHEIFDDLGLHFTSRMHYKDSNLRSVDLALDKLDTKMELHPERFHDFNGNIHYEDQQLVIKDFHGEIGATTFTIDLAYFLGDNENQQQQDNYLEVSADYIDYDALFRFDPNPPAATQATFTTEDVAEHATAFNIYELPFPNMRYKANIGRFRYHRIDLQNIEAALRTTPNHYLYVDTLNMDAAGGNIRLSGYFNGSDPDHIYMQPNLEVSNVDLEKLLFKFENFGQDHLVSENLQGAVTASISGKIRVYPDLVPDLDQSNLEMDVKVYSGTLKNYDPMLALSDYMGDKNLKSIRFDTLQNNLAIDKGKISIPAMTIESSIGHMELSGTHDSDQNIDYYLRIPWKTVRKATWQKLFGGNKDSIVDPEQVDDIVKVDPERNTKFLNLKIQGTVDDYKVSLGKQRK
ncbi:AsmA-like C-terminal region [Robiginitalea myxolifaciens]|uniref:AsmA-like C-terminal region n=1 Tax=Robiginitalea myxolifaciens TaxID=400055 RepID=A0A1I6HBG4_9FLAO|nr:AsmA-like C-terminal region-containing protein [Robiginitalea myxolifaciens]SFR51700.1 AsmA-like C-terminal region [Robiginitalea myxolifaciens]